MTKNEQNEKMQSEKILKEMKEENNKLRKQRDRMTEYWKKSKAKYPNGANGCCCLFDNDQNQIAWCSIHAGLRDEIIEKDNEILRMKGGDE